MQWINIKNIVFNGKNLIKNWKLQLLKEQNNQLFLINSNVILYSIERLLYKSRNFEYVIIYLELINRWWRRIQKETQSFRKSVYEIKKKFKIKNRALIY